MTPEQVLACPSRVLQQSERERFFQLGYQIFPGLLAKDDLSPLRTLTDQLIDQSRELNRSTRVFDLEPDHTPDHPRLRRIAFVDDLHDEFWHLCKDSIITDIAEDILGPNLRFRDIFINLKCPGGGSDVKWHQDIAFYPHTNVGTCQFLVALDAIGDAQGPLQVIPGSHRGEIYSHYNLGGEWTGSIGERDLGQAGIDQAIPLTGPPGTVTVHHSCTIHGSDRNLSQHGRPVLVITYSAADAIPYTAAPYPSSHYGRLVRGEAPRYSHHQELHMPLPPDWSEGYTSIYDHQQVD